jgi:hypothetical protein
MQQMLPKVRATYRWLLAYVPPLFERQYSFITLRLHLLARSSSIFDGTSKPGLMRAQTGLKIEPKPGL